MQFISQLLFDQDQNGSENAFLPSRCCSPQVSPCSRFSSRSRVPLSHESAFEGYRYDEHGLERPLACTIACLGGDEDGGAPRSDLEHWASFTTGEFRLRMFPGGHFFLKDEGSAVVLDYLRQVLAL